MTCRSIQRFCGAHHTPGLGALVADLVVCQINLRDGRVYLQCLCQALEAATDQGWRLVRGPFGQNLISDMSNLSDSKLEKTIQKSTVSFSIYVQSHTAGLGVFDNSTRSEMNDETTVTTAPANHPNFLLLEDVENMTS